jgi:hypothetical protein
MSTISVSLSRRLAETHESIGLKDNRLLLAAGEEAAVPMPFASVVRDRS